MSDNRIILRLDQRIAFERDFSIQYKNMPRARRQEWVRSVLRAGLAAVEGIIQGPSISPASTYVPSASALEAPSAPIAVLPTPVVKPAAAKSKTPAGDLAGFFGETKGRTP